MSYEFTKLSEVPAVSEFPEGANAIIETNGEIKRCPSSGGGGGSGQFIVNVYNANVAGTEYAADKTYEEISAAIESGMSVVIHKKENISAATYQVFYHNETGNGFYKFCHVKVGKKIEAHNIGIRMVNGVMVIDVLFKEIQVVTP